MKQKDIVIFGAGGMAQTVHALLRHHASGTVAAFTVDGAYIKSAQFDGLPVVPFDTLTARFPPDRYDLLIAIGQADRNRARARVFEAALAAGYALRSYIDPGTRVYDSNKIGRGCLIFDGISLQPFAEIGDNVVVRPLAYIGHHAVIESHAFVAPHAALLGYSRIGAFSFVGAHATVSSRVQIGAGCVIGAGAVVTQDLPPRSVVRSPKSASAEAGDLP